MNRMPLPWIFFAGACVALGDPIDHATIAAMKLSEAPNYSWTCTVQDDARSYVKEGKYVQTGYTWVTLPMLEAIEKRLGRDANTDIETIFRGRDHCVIRVGERWKTVKQLPKAPRGHDDVLLIYPQPSRAMLTADMPADTTLLEDPFPPVIVVAPLKEREENRPFSNARLAPSPPHEELGIIVSSWANVAADDERVKGRLSDLGARLLLCPGSEHEGEPLIAAGEFTLWMKDNVVTRYAVNLEGVVLVGKKKILVRQSSETRLHDVGKTNFTVPDEARAKLEQ